MTTPTDGSEPTVKVHVPFDMELGRVVIAFTPVDVNQPITVSDVAVKVCAHPGELCFLQPGLKKQMIFFMLSITLQMILSFSYL